MWNGILYYVYSHELEGQGGECGSLNETGPHRFLYLNTWSPGGGTVLGRIRWPF